MSEQKSSPQSFPISVASHDIDRRKKIVGLDQADIARIVSSKDVVLKRVDDYTEAFFSYLANLGEASALFSRRDALDEAKRRKREHVIALAAGDYGSAYVEQRIALGTLYSRYGVETSAFLGAFHHMMGMIGADIMTQSARSPDDAFQKFMSLQKVSLFDIGIITDVLIAERERTISLQQDAIRELSTPVLQVRERLLVLPIIGILDSRRAKQMTDSLLRAIRENRARVVVMDITGVAAVDSKVANHLIQTVAAARLMGSLVIVTGLSADVAQSLVALGVDLAKINTMADLQGGLEEAESILGYKVSRANGLASPRQQS
jgi:rsbT co-antagonist protein RsbR